MNRPPWWARMLFEMRVDDRDCSDDVLALLARKEKCWCLYIITCGIPTIDGKCLQTFDWRTDSVIRHTLALGMSCLNNKFIYFLGISDLTLPTCA